jgi:hypothetical protein
LSLKLFTLDMRVAAGATAKRPASEGVPAMFEALLEVFAPRDIAMWIDGRETTVDRIDRQRSYGDEPLWLGEEITGDALTGCPPGPARELVHEARAVLAGRLPERLVVRATGALLHQAPWTPRPAWFGRWRVDHPALHELVSVRYERSAARHAFEFILPLSGYPLTSSRLTGEAHLDPGDRASAAVNRATLIPVIARVRDAFGFELDDVDWSNGGDYHALYPHDRADVEKVWLPALRGAS